MKFEKKGYNYKETPTERVIKILKSKKEMNITNLLTETHMQLYSLNMILDKLQKSGLIMIVKDTITTFEGKLITNSVIIRWVGVK